MAETTIAYPPLWFTSGTPHRLGQRGCAYERWLGYHAGPHGTGYRRRATAVPLATGSAVHTGVGLLGEWILDWQKAHPTQRLTALPDEVIAWAATEAAQGYEVVAKSRGLELTKTDLDAKAAVDQLILEQSTLIEGLTWLYGLARIPIMLSISRLVDVEREEGPVVQCTCGLGDWVGQWTDHLGRGCQGICPMGRGDAIWELIDDLGLGEPGALVYEEVKTKATPNYGWEQQWEHSGQLWLTMEAASKRLGKPVTQAYVPVLYKGKRDRSNRKDQTAPKIQQSALVWAWFDEGAPPLRPMEWASRFKWWDDWGKGHTLPKTYKRRPIWDDTYPLPDENPNQAQIRPEASRVERWIKGWIAPGQYREFLQVLGPYPRPAALMLDAERSLVVEEEEWRRRVKVLRELGLYEPGSTASYLRVQGEPPVTVTAADFISRSWQCTGFDGTPCQFKGICHREPGWEDIDGLDRYEIRTPHHAIEKEAMTATIESLKLAWTDPEDEQEIG